MPRELPGFTLGRFAHGGKTRPVYRAGSGPAVVVVHEMPGITPEVAAFGRRVAEAGFTAVLPSLFGTPGRPVSGRYLFGSMVGACVSREFATLALNRTSAVTEWLRALARHEHAECGGPGVGALGMCFTGGFALAMMLDDSVIAPVLSQPSLPLPLGRKRRAAPGISEADFARVEERCATGTCVLGLRFTADWMSPGARFGTLKKRLGDHFIAVEIDSSPGNVHGIPARAHSVVTVDLVDEPGHPTREALDTVLRFFAERLTPEG
jgi:dienelactone hydrolase